MCPSKEVASYRLPIASVRFLLMRAWATTFFQYGIMQLEEQLFATLTNTKCLWRLLCSYPPGLHCSNTGICFCMHQFLYNYVKKQLPHWDRSGQWLRLPKQLAIAVTLHYTLSFHLFFVSTCLKLTYKIVVVSIFYSWKRTGWHEKIQLSYDRRSGYTAEIRALARAIRHHQDASRDIWLGSW